MSSTFGSCLKYLKLIWKLICFCLSCLFQEVKRFIVNLVRKLSIQYFNKIKLNFFAREHCIGHPLLLPGIRNSAVDAGEMGS